MPEELRTNVDEILKKMKSLQCYFYQLKRERKLSGSAAEKHIKRAFFESLQFLDENVESNPTVRNLEESSASSSKRNNRHAKRKRNDFQAAHSSLLERIIDALEKKVPTFWGNCCNKNGKSRGMRRKRRP